MGHVIFVFLHILALLFSAIWLVITIPAHLIYAAIRGNRPAEGERPSPWTHVRCPDCKELVHKEANVCKHCGAKLVPESKIAKMR